MPICVFEHVYMDVGGYVCLKPTDVMCVYMGVGGYVCLKPTDVMYVYEFFFLPLRAFLCLPAVG